MMCHHVLRNVESELLEAEPDSNDNSQSSKVDVVRLTMEGLPQDGALTLIVNSKPIVIRIRYLFDDDDIKVRLNYSDMASLLREYNAKNFAEMNLEFFIEFEHENGEKYSLKLGIPKTLMESRADELEAIEASRSTQ